ncbi:DUF4296 domain-containing protein [Prolixibacteraceae bacterium Z1-6]|uniref:DUF4296 domain-containing protein n=1 Tax=Draconibacterium aestuarii TaxID=2998507 RepID=A0A9X3F9H0_9BACT|nr:DUF4296 domain-containing protein [Prolixibacteraceae bacterium Z1-6]
MKKLQLIFLVLIFALGACKKDEVIPKPKDLIKEKQMIDMLVDIHLAEATFNKFRYDSIMQNNSSVNYYYSVLDKYQIPDSVFEKSFVYYASGPKNFEKMYRKVMNNLSQIEQEFSGRKEELLNLEEEIKRK